MSRELYIVCEDCHEYLWIATEGLSGRTFFFGVAPLMQELRDFFFDHENHRLLFEDSQRGDDHEDYRERTPEIPR